MPTTAQQSANVEPRVRERAEKLWRAAGKPTAGARAYFDEARQLIAIEDNPRAGTEPVGAGYNKPGPWGEPVEEAQVALDNEGEFPTMTDQGEQENPRARHARSGHHMHDEDSHMDAISEVNPGTEARIRDRAYQLWLEEGRPHGRDQEHWSRARSEIEEEGRPPKSEMQAPPGPAFSDPVTAAIDPPVKTETAAKKKRSLKSAKS